MVFAQQSTDLRLDSQEREPIGAAAVRYENYKEKHKNITKSSQKIFLLPEEASIVEGDAFLEETGQASSSTVLVTHEDSLVSWTYDVVQSGTYTITVNLDTRSHKNSYANRTLLIDNELPFKELSELVFYRYYKDSIDGNRFILNDNYDEVRPKSSENIVQTSQTLVSQSGLPFELYMEEGQHTLTLVATKDMLAIYEIVLGGVEELREYSEIEKEYKEKKYNIYDGNPIILEGEITYGKSDPAIVPTFDKTSAATSPQSPQNILLNVIGGSSWQNSGQWIEWAIDIKESGLYKLNFRYKQNSSQEVPSMRTLSIDGKIPFLEAQNILFPFGDKWQIKSLGDQDPLLIYLEEGERILRLTVSLGGLAKPISQVSDSLDDLNIIFRQILSITGPNPDVNRDYDFDKITPEILENMRTISTELKISYGLIRDITKEDGSLLSIIQTLYTQLDLMVDKPYLIAKQFSNFKNNLSGLGNWIFSASKQPLLIDSISVSGENNHLVSGDGGFFQQFVFNVKLFLSSFLNDYGAISRTKEKMVVWVPTGRDQWQIIKNLTDYSFNESNEKDVMVNLVPPTSLLPSTLAGKAPDVALSNQQQIPVEFAARGAVAPLDEMQGFDKILSRFTKSAVQPFYFNDKIYGLPENQTWPMLFCRQDILSELNLDVPESWDDVISLLPVIKRKNMQFGMLVGYSGFLQVLYQNGGKLYTSDSPIKTGLDTNESFEAFALLCNMFTQYKLPIEYDAANRFRSGEMPILVADYSFYNQLAAFAPEIRGLWTMHPQPGIKKDNGDITNLGVSTTTASIILSQSKNKDLAWEYIKWWTSLDTQTQFANEMEIVIGPSAKQPTANVEALRNLSWTNSEYLALSKQQQNSIGIPVVPGYYQAERLITFAFNNVYNMNSDPIEKIEDTITSINTELQRKEKEIINK